MLEFAKIAHTIFSFANVQVSLSVETQGFSKRGFSDIYSVAFFFLS